MSTCLDLPFTASLVALLTLSCLSIWLDLQLWCQAKGFKSNSVGIFENSDLVWILPSFSPKVFLKLLSGARTFSLCIPVSNKKIYIWCNVLCNVWSWMTFPSTWTCFFHLNLFCSSFLGFFAFLCSCILYRPARLVYRASILSLKNIFTLDVFLSCHNFLCVRIVIFRFNCRRHTRLTSIFLCWVLTNWFPHCQ